MSLETSEPSLPAGTSGLLCKPESGDPFLVIRIDKSQPQQNVQVLETIQAARLKPHAWGSFLLGFANDGQRDKVLAALPRIE